MQRLPASGAGAASTSATAAGAAAPSAARGMGLTAAEGAPEVNQVTRVWYYARTRRVLSARTRVWHHRTC
eukprot:789221-Rhodomonas_salina.1